MIILYLLFNAALLLDTIAYQLIFTLLFFSKLK